jgi:hypothetical protein
MSDVTAAENAQIGGEWTVNAEAMGQALQISLNLEQNGSDVTGRMESALGGGDLSGTVTGNSFSAVSKTEIMGQAVELTITGTVDGDSMSGSINAGMPGLPDLPFSGKRA